MVPPDDKQKLLDELENLPIVSVVCKRAGISKATIYRWLEGDTDFKKKYDRALKRGRERLVDHAESKLLKLIEKEQFCAIRYFLNSNSKRYFSPRKPISAPEIERIIQAVEIRTINELINFEEAKKADKKKLEAKTRKKTKPDFRDLPG